MKVSRYICGFVVLIKTASFLKLSEKMNSCILLNQKSIENYNNTVSFFHGSLISIKVFSPN